MKILCNLQTKRNTLLHPAKHAHLKTKLAYRNKQAWIFIFHAMDFEKASMDMEPTMLAFKHITRTNFGSPLSL